MRLPFLLPLLALSSACSNGGGSPDGGNNHDNDAGPVLSITTADSTPMSFVPGAAVALTVVLLQPDGTTTPLPAGAQITWTAPPTVVAADPNDAGGAALPALSPLAFFVSNPFRPDRSDYDSVLFVVQAGSTDSPNLTVSASVAGYGSVTAYIPIRGALVGDPDAGASEYQALKCDQCHGATGAGTPPNDAGMYVMQGGTYPFPAPSLNACSGSCAYNDGGDNTAPQCACAAADSTWNGAYFGLAGQADIDNNGVALRTPMPDALGSSTAQQFADIYAYMRTQPE